MSSACQQVPSPASSSSVEHNVVLDAMGGRTASQISQQHVLPFEQILLTTNLCADVDVRTGAALRWYRHKPKGYVAQPSDWCRDQKPGQRTRFTTHVHAAWNGSAGISVPCSTLQPLNVLRHDYCLKATPFDTAPSDAVWKAGVALIGSEAHIENFHHANRDTLFFHRFLRRFAAQLLQVNSLFVLHPGDVVDWVIDHLQAVLPADLIRRVIWAPHSRRGIQPNKRSISNATLFDHLPSPRSSDAYATDMRSKKAVCFMAAAEKLLTDTGDREDFQALRRRAYSRCGIHPPAPPPAERYVLLVLRGEPDLQDSPSTARQIANPHEVQETLKQFAASTFGPIPVRTTAFARLSYCEQVRLAAGARLLVGVHGQGITNGQFLRNDAWALELFHGGKHPYWSSLEHIGHQPLYRAAGLRYMAAPLAESDCRMMEWKFDPRCKSYINPTRLHAVLNELRQSMAAP